MASHDNFFPKWEHFWYSHKFHIYVTSRRMPYMLRRGGHVPSNPNRRKYTRQAGLRYEEISSS